MNAQQVQVLLHTFSCEYFKISSPVVVQTKKKILTRRTVSVGSTVWRNTLEEFKFNQTKKI